VSAEEHASYAIDGVASASVHWAIGRRQTATTLAA
jgi:hypothetical protein